MYTPRGSFTPAEDPWVDPDGTVRDPFRPTIQHGNVKSVAEMEADRRQHPAAVRRMLAELDVLVFTLSLTECWLSREDGAVFPLCPGVEGGTFDLVRYAFLDRIVMEVTTNMAVVLAALRAVSSPAEVDLACVADGDRSGGRARPFRHDPLEVGAGGGSADAG